MTLSRLLVAWLAVAALFVIACSPRGRLLGQSPAEVVWRALEAAVTTLLASLWFASLGSGEWWLVFLLVGMLVGLAGRVAGGGTPSSSPSPAFSAVSRETLWRGLRDTGRYLLAGAILAWRLG